MKNKSFLFMIGITAITAFTTYHLTKNKSLLISNIETNEKNLKRLKFLRRKRKILPNASSYLLKIMTNLDNNRLIFVEVKAKNNSTREYLLKQLEKLKTDEPVDEMWFADFHKQSYSRTDIVALLNKKAIFYLSNFNEIAKLRVSARTTVAKLIGVSLSKLTTKFPSAEKFIFDPMLDLYAPLKETEEILNFGVVEENQLYRGGMLVGSENYDNLKEFGVKTVINLKIEDSAIEFVSEQNALLKRNILLYYIPMPNVAAPSIVQAMEFLTYVYDVYTKPVFVHCHRGADRTGVMVAIFRITQGYTAAKALLEAQKYNMASNIHVDKVNFVYDFEKKWLEWKDKGSIPNNLTNFDFLSLLSEEEKEDNIISDL